MASGVALSKIEIDKSACRQVLNSKPVMAKLNDLGKQAVDYADGVGTATYAMHDAQAGRQRAHVIVYTPSVHAIRSNAVHDTLACTLASLRSK